MNDQQFDITARQVATTELSAVARLDRPTEDRLYALYRDFFRVAEEQRRWSVWADIPWDETPIDPSIAVIEAVLASYREDVFLPDYSSSALRIMRASRGRAWFITRWSYEEGKHMLTLNEWLLRSNTMTDVEVRELTEAHLRSFRWVPPYEDAIPVFVDMLLWELNEIARYSAMHDLAGTVGDHALTVATAWILRDETAHRDFQRAALGICVDSYRDAVESAITVVAQAQEYPGGAVALRAALAIPGI